MRISALFAILMLVSVSTALADALTSQDATQPQTSASSAANTLAGCLKGSQDQYYLVEKNGHRHTLQANNQDLSTHVNHQVTVTGKADTSRNPAASADAEGHRKGYFYVESVSDQGACKK